MGSRLAWAGPVLADSLADIAPSGRRAGLWPARGCRRLRGCRAKPRLPHSIRHTELGPSGSLRVVMGSQTLKRLPRGPEDVKETTGTSGTL